MTFTINKEGFMLSKNKITPRQQEFIEKSINLGYEPIEYHGRNFHRGYGIVVDNINDVIAELGMKGLRSDNMGLQYIVYI